MNISKFLFSTDVLHNVLKPGRYIGGEYNEIIKSNSSIKIALCFPDIYDIGMSHTGFQILYNLFNSFNFVSTERVFLPWVDMIEKMEQYKVPLYSLETYTPIKNFDLLGITLQYELSYPNILKVLSMSNIPIYSEERKEEDPIVLGGGPCSSNPEPIAPFFDAFFIGDGEKVAKDIVDILNNFKSREQRLIELSKLEGVYVPKLNKPMLKDGLLVHDKNKIINSVKLNDLNNFRFPINQIVSNIKIVHLRAIVEVMRGCNRGCRFCHAGMFYRPTRERSIEKMEKIIYEILESTGFHEISLLSLSTLDYSTLNELIDRVLPYLKEKHVSLSLPSSRVDKFSVELSSKLSSGRKAGLTFAPEAGSQRMRDIINKGIEEEGIFNVVKMAKENGWNRIKLYFMIGLPNETKEDVEAIVKLAKNLKKHSKLKEMTVNVSVFIPKPHTPFQYSKFEDLKSLKNKIKILYQLKKYRIRVNIQDPYQSYIEAILALGDQNVSKILYDIVFEESSIFQQWDENFNFNSWARVFNKNEFDSSKYLDGFEGTLPWEFINTGVSQEFLENEWEKAKNIEKTEDCRWSSCSMCGVCNKTLKVIVNKKQ